MSVTARLDAYQRRHRRAGFPLAVGYKFFDDQGGYLAALITFYGFLSIFPLLFMLATMLGIVLQGNPEWQARILDSALSQFPLIGAELGDPQGLRGSRPALALAFAGSLYGALGVGQAIQYATNTAWAVPRNRRPNPFLSRLRGLVLLATGGGAVLATTVLSALGSSGLFGLGASLRVLATLLSVAVNIVVFTVVFEISCARRLPLRDMVPGAVGAAVIWQLLQSFGAVYVAEVVQDAGAVNGVFAIVLGLIAYLYLSAVSIVFCMEVNVVRAKKLYPRALLTPFTDDVDLTPGDRSAYADSAKAQRTKGFEEVEVSFENDGQNASARRRRRQD